MVSSDDSEMLARRSIGAATQELTAQSHSFNPEESLNGEARGGRNSAQLAWSSSISEGRELRIESLDSTELPKAESGSCRISGEFQIAIGGRSQGGIDRWSMISKPMKIMTKKKKKKNQDERRITSA